MLYVIGRYTSHIPNTLYYIFSLSIGFTLVLFLYLVLHEVLNLFHKTLRPLDKSKRDFIKKSADISMVALSASYVGKAIYEGSKSPIINTVDLGIFDFKIVQISDLHIGGLIDHDFVRETVRQINTLDADIVCLTGDMIDTKLSSIKDIVLELKNIKAKHGIYYILGNHEYFHNPMEIITFLQQTPIKVLLNESISIDALKVNIVGVTDRIGYRKYFLAPDIDKAFAHTNPNYKSILLAHQPKFIEELAQHKPALILSGHTHGGQIWPFEYLIRLQQPYIKGLHTLENGSQIYVNSGIGFWGPPMRLDSQAEIALLL